MPTIKTAGAIAAVTVAALFRLGHPAGAEDVGDTVLGRLYAEANCTECHAIEPDATTSPVFDAPAFEVIANTHGMSLRALNVWFKSPHPNMPLLILEPHDADNVGAYLMSLKD